ncbi:hypothetical protein TTRE_0000445301 [Trichuris trichiura]|uniref:Cadherin domain containing protein n=1 Tax=Trichuris trichiura TaxID=36087 RepID=A0A077Z971_TRITR|nr:hypothetical protein TTRE_0000445301 [Trichuris trichiura]
MPSIRSGWQMTLLLWLILYHAVEAFERVVIPADSKAGLAFFKARGATIARVLPLRYFKYFLPHGNELVLGSEPLSPLIQLSPLALDLILHWRLDGGTALDRVERLIVEIVPSSKLSRKTRDAFEPCGNVFSQKRFPLKVSSDTAVGSTVRRIEAVCNRRQAFTYSLEPVGNNSHPPFDVDPLTGDLFTTRRLSEENAYQFYIVAKPMGIRKRSKALVDIQIIQDSQRHRGLKKKKKMTMMASRRKRELRKELSFRLPENIAVGRLLPGAGQFVPLQRDQVVKSAPAVKDHFIVHRNGSIEVAKALNFEVESVHRFTVIVENIRTSGDYNA